jgi:hypothetical protein
MGNRRRSPRYKVRWPVRISLLHTKVQVNGAHRSLPSVEGYTRDVSASGLALIVTAIRINDRYLTGEGQRLEVVLEHPTGNITMQVAPVRYEQLDESETEKGYLIGVRIITMTDEERARYLRRDES